MVVSKGLIVIPKLYDIKIVSYAQRIDFSSLANDRGFSFCCMIELVNQFSLSEELDAKKMMTVEPQLMMLKQNYIDILTPTMKFQFENSEV